MRHQKHGYQTTIKNDLYMVEEQLQAYDPTLYIMFNPNDGSHLIMDGLMDLAIMRIPQIGFETLDSRVVEHIRKIHTKRGFQASYELQEAEERMQREQEQQIEDMSYWMAKDLKRPLIEAADYGRL